MTLVNIKKLKFCLDPKKGEILLFLLEQILHSPNDHHKFITFLMKNSSGQVGNASVKELFFLSAFH